MLYFSKYIVLKFDTSLPSVSIDKKCILVILYLSSIDDNLIVLHRPKRKMRQNASKKETKYQQITFFRYL
jgi:hypothetical protein